MDNHQDHQDHQDDGSVVSLIIMGMPIWVPTPPVTDFYGPTFYGPTVCAGIDDDGYPYVIG